MSTLLFAIKLICVWRDQSDSMNVMDLQETFDGEDELVPRPRVKSELWNYFGLKVDVNRKPIDDGRVFCRICHRGVMASNDNSSNPKAYLKNNHKPAHSQLKQPKQPLTSNTARSSNQPTISTSFTQSQPYSHQSKK